MRTELRTPHLSVASGTPTVIEIEVANTSDIIDGVTAIVEGLDPAWVHLPIPVLSLFPEASGTYPLHVRLPPEVAAGEYLLTVRVVSTINASQESVHDLWLTVEPVEKASLLLRPSAVIGGKRGVLQAIITNEGNVETQYNVSAVDETRALDCSTDPLSVVVPAGQERSVAVHMTGRRPWFGQALTRTVIVTAASAEHQLPQAATFTQKPRIPRGVLTMAILATVVALWATIFLVVIDVLRAENPPKKAVAANFNSGGAQAVPLADVAGAALGTVTAGGTGAGLPRITVEAYRQRPDGGSEQSGSAATGDDGAYTLAALLPGSYKLRFTADGFDELWYPDTADAADAEVITIQPTAKKENLDVSLNGKLGAIVGAIEAPDSAGSAPPMTVTVTKVVEQGAGATGGGDVTTGTDPTAPPPPEPVVVQTTREFRVEGLVTPATYRIRVESPGFDPQVFEETLAGGEIKVLNTVKLGAALGSIAGVVVTADGFPLGNVAVEVRSGELVKKTTTPTAGNVGVFVVEDLQTPRTYVITFTLDGFSSQTIALDLLAGQTRPDVTAVLVGGTGSIAGSVTDAGGQPLGGVKVVVERGKFTGSTATLTTASASAGIGGYAIADIPTPGIYTVTFSQPGFVSETRIVVFLAPGTQAGVDAALRPAQATVSGTVTGGGRLLASATVELSDGTTTRTTSTASSPAGAYSFANVEPGTYTLTAQLPGFETRVVIVRVAAGDAIDRPIDLPRSG